MSKVLLYLCLLMASAVIAGEGVTYPEDNQPLSLQQASDLEDSLKADCDDHDEMSTQKTGKACHRYYPSTAIGPHSEHTANPLSAYAVRAPPYYL